VGNVLGEGHTPDPRVDTDEVLEEEGSGADAKGGDLKGKGGYTGGL